jgi:hypothetical protein
MQTAVQGRFGRSAALTVAAAGRAALTALAGLGLFDVANDTAILI